MSTKTAIVTGAAQGTGRAIALRLAEDGYNVVVCDLPSQATLMDAVVSEIVSKGRKSLAIAADISKEKDIDNLVQSTVSTLGGLDVMVANAGIAMLSTILETSVEEWENIMSVNLKGTFLCYKAAAKVMIDQGRGGCIIGASSLAGKKSGAFASAYGSSKFAIRCLTQAAAAEWAKFGIRVNGYAAGLTNTPLLHRMNARFDELINTPGSNAYIEGMKLQTALGRIGEPEEIASLVSFLASKESSFIVGQTISVDGGIWFD